MALTQSTLEWTEAERVRVLSHLDEVLEHSAFAGSRRRQAFLRYVVDETLAGRGAAIKERNIAIDVFERSGDFDAQHASIVRVTGLEVRKRLAQFYAECPGSNVRIEIPVGSYAPVLHLEAEVAAVEPQVISVLTEPRSARTSPRNWMAILVASVALLIVAVLSAMALSELYRRPTATDRLWQPFLDPQRPVLLSLATLVNSQSETSFVGTGGALAAARFAEQLALRRQQFVLKFGTDVTFSDLKTSASILIGSTKWSDETMRNMRFRIERGDQTRAVVDSQAPDVRWSVPRNTQPNAPLEGFAIVTRLLATESGHPMLLVSGIDPRDTQAAVEFIANDRLFESFVNSVSPDWTKKNFQIVVHDRIYGNSPGSVNIVSSHIW